MLGVGGLSFSLGMGVSVVRFGLTEKAGSRYDSRNFPLIFTPLDTGRHAHSQIEMKRLGFHILMTLIYRKNSSEYTTRR